MVDEADLPSWAEPAGTHRDIPAVQVDADEMYETLLTELQELYAEDPPEIFTDSEGALTAEGENCLGRLDSDDPSVYWLEVAYQMMKMDLWVALGTMTLEIRVSDPEKSWAQEKYDEGRGTDQASGGLHGAREATDHYRNLRGVVPAGVRA